MLAYELDTLRQEKYANTSTIDKSNEPKTYVKPDVAVCPPDCIEVRESSINIDNDFCIDCDLCVYICPIEVLSS